ncbi:chaperone protein DnaJ [Acrasis kona]|uniref:Chaperone protein DnaJ n=1 Tax=Acrasis kona TaxID=1008807 RepID=A0AAW2YLM8_9EUKA
MFKLRFPFTLHMRYYSTFKGVRFQESKQKAAETFKEFARTRLLSPQSWENNGDIFSYYIPYHVLNGFGEVSYQVKLGTHHTETFFNPQTRRFENRTKTSWVSAESDAAYRVHDQVVYASTNFERGMVEKAIPKDIWDYVRRDQVDLQYESSEYKVDIYTIDLDTAVDIFCGERLSGIVQAACYQDARRKYPGYDEYNVIILQTSYASGECNLFYLPTFVLLDSFRNHTFNSFLSGYNITDYTQVVGYRHFSFVKTFAATLGIEICFFYFFHSPVLFPFIGAIAAAVAFAATRYPFIIQQYYNYKKQNFEKQYTSSEAKQARANQRQQQQQGQQHYKQQQQYQQSSYGGARVKQDKNEVNYYTLIGLDPKKKDAYTEEEIKKAYRKAAIKYHPDMHPEEKKNEMSDRFKLINQAYSVLSDKGQRQSYNRNT